MYITCINLGTLVVVVYHEIVENVTTTATYKALYYLLCVVVNDPEVMDGTLGYMVGPPGGII